ncbi:MAG: DUF4258 domain-containing protein [Planctomycetota bacterium]|nr:MAG: DUF4258 domain-containing protein [Planctomycetota bacterium]
MDYKRVIFSGHAIRQMFSRAISKDDVLVVIRDGEVITDYPDDKPYPSCLILGFVKNSPIHVVFTFDRETKIGIVITAYIPDLRLWTENFKSRRQS